MSWDAPAQRALRGAEALFAASDLGWFDALGAPWSGDPWAAFERLIRETLATTGAPAAPPAEAPLPALAPLRPRPLAQGLPTPMALSHPAPLASDPARAASVPPSLPMPRAEALVPRALAPASAPLIERPAVGRAARVTALASRRTVPPPALGAAAAPPDRLWPGAAAPPDEADAAPLAAAPSPTPGARMLRLHDLPVAPGAPRAVGDRVATLARPRLALQRVEALPAAATRPAAGAEALPATSAPRRTRLVDGLPALRSLLQAAVAESRERPPGPAEAAAAPAGVAMPPPPSAPASTTALAPLRALPQLDAVAEDMLVDRIADRLQERLREQALRQFGFTGGLT